MSLLISNFFLFAVDFLTELELLMPLTLLNLNSQRTYLVRPTTPATDHTEMKVMVILLLCSLNFMFV